MLVSITIVFPDISPFVEFFGVSTSVIRDNFNTFYAIYIILIFLFMFGNTLGNFAKLFNQARKRRPYS